MGYTFNKAHGGFVTRVPNTDPTLFPLFYPAAVVLAGHWRKFGNDHFLRAMNIPDKYRIWYDLPFTRIFLNFTAVGDGCFVHIDRNDILCSFLTIGTFTGGQFAVLPERQLYTMGNFTFVNLLSSKMPHGSYPLKTGSRAGVVFVAHSSLLKDRGNVKNDFK